jgi:hypothetical protein
MLMDDQHERVRVAKKWSAIFVDHPDVLASIIADLLKQAYALPGRIGQRPLPYESDVDIMGLLYGDYADDPLWMVLPSLMDMSTTSLAFISGVPESLISAALRPEGDPRHVELTMPQLEALAAGLGKPAWYFAEWRVLAVSEAIAALLRSRPGLATSLFRDHVRFEEES